MNVSGYLRTRDLAQAGGISVQQVRNYEATGFVPKAKRSPSGYRLYTPEHLASLKTARSLVTGHGWPRARAIMREVNRGDLVAALALIDEYHAELAGRRLRVEQTLAALRTLSAQPSELSARYRERRLRVGAAARQVGVRVSALRFWEQQGLLHPVRDERSGYRLYDERQMRRLRVVALLREADYDFDTIHMTLDELAAGRPERAIAAVERRRADIARASWACLAALTAFRDYIGEYRADLCLAF